MKHRTASLLVILLQFSCLDGAEDFAGANYSTSSGFSLSTDTKLPDREAHPSLWLSKEQLAELKARIGTNGTMQSYWEQVSNSRYLTMPIPDEIWKDGSDCAAIGELDGNQIHKYYGDMTQIAIYCAFMAWMAEDEDQRQAHLDRAVATLMRAYDGPIWKLDPTKDGVNEGVDEVYRCIWAQSLCAAYDFVQPYLTGEQDGIIRARLLREAETTYENLHVWSHNPNNHLSKPAWALATFALTFPEEAEADEWLRSALEAANENTRYFFSSDGIYREGALYYLYSWLNFVPFLYHYRNVAAIDCFEDFKPSLEWCVIARNAKGWLMNVEDSYIRPIPTQMVAGPFAGSRSFLNPSVPFSEVLQWNFKTTEYAPFEKAERKSGFNYTGATWDYPKELYELITYDPAISASAPTVDPTIFMEGGQTVFRNSWTNAPEAQLYLLFHSVPQANNHDHHDTLSFVLYANNQMMASDSGYSRGSYGEPVRYAYYRMPEAHNTITMDGIPLGDFIENTPNPSEDRINTSFFDFERKRAPFRKYLGRVVGTADRSIAFIQNEYFLVLDEVLAGGSAADRPEATIDTYFHGGRASLSIEDNLYVWSYPDDAYGSAAKLATYQFTTGGQTTTFQGENTYIKADWAEFPSLKTTNTANQSLGAQLLYPLDPDEPVPVVTDLSTQGFLAARIRTGNTIDCFMKCHAAAGGSIEGISFDGDFIWFRKNPGGLAELAGQSVRAVSMDGKDLLCSDERVSFAMRPGEVSELGLAVRQPTRIRVFVGREVSSLTCEGHPVKFRNEEGYLVFTAEDSGTYLFTRTSWKRSISVLSGPIQSASADTHPW